MFGLSFLLSWLASATAAAAASFVGARVGAAARVLAPAVLTVSILMGLGAARAPYDGPTVRVAAVALADAATGRSSEYGRLLAAWRADGADAPDALDAEDDRSIAAAVSAITDTADRGATIVYVAETNVHVRAERTATLEATIGALARSRRIWIGLGVGAALRGAEPNLRNEIVLFDPSGAVAARFAKAHAIGSETHDMVLGSGEVPVRVAQGARIAGIICFDSDFVTFTRSIARQGVDILFVPTNDWSAIAEMRAAVTRFRALETGAVLVRPASHGVSEIVAPDGRLLARARYDDTRGTLLVADVPARGEATAYAAAGDWPAVGSLGLLTILIVAWRLRQNGRGSRSRLLDA
jgi:apolipoprotein N-acyltransferase